MLFAVLPRLLHRGDCRDRTPQTPREVPVHPGATAAPTCILESLPPPHHELRSLRHEVGALATSRERNPQVGRTPPHPRTGRCAPASSWPRRFGWHRHALAPTRSPPARILAMCSTPSPSGAALPRSMASRISGSRYTENTDPSRGDSDSRALSKLRLWLFASERRRPGRTSIRGRKELLGWSRRKDQPTQSVSPLRRVAPARALWQPWPLLR